MSQKVIVVSNHHLLNDILPFLKEGRKVKIRAKGSSMMPLVRNGVDSLILKQLKDDSVRKGNIVLALLADGHYVLHRVVSVRDQDVVLRGDGNPYQKEYCLKSDILAEAVGVERHGGRIIPKGSFMWRLVRYFWPVNGFFRRMLLFVLHRL